tara:strand:- start:17406 stop:17588 length:183 start_codon:yes stop_codon:yes gene_type:complete
MKQKGKIKTYKVWALLEGARQPPFSEIIGEVKAHEDDEAMEKANKMVKISNKTLTHVSVK